MDTRPVIAVIGATGTQGGGLIRTLHADPARTFLARAVTRDPESPAAARIAAEGSEVCFGNLDEPGSLGRAFQGVHGVYAMTNYWSTAARSASSRKRTISPPQLGAPACATSSGPLSRTHAFAYL